MNNQTITNEKALPTRFKRLSPLAWLGLVVFLAFFLHGMYIGDLTPARLTQGAGRLGEFLQLAFPPKLDRLPNLLMAILETFEMALTGTVFGAVLSLPLALLASKNLSPNPVTYYITRFFIAFLRSVPDLVWGLILLVIVGLGPGAGILAIAVHVMGFCGRFFAESIEEIDKGSIEALKMTGVSNFGVVIGAVIPSALSSFIASAMYALESSVRSAVVLGVVGAGGIGIELTTSMQLLRYDEAFAAILVIFATVVATERVSSVIRKHFI
jgi:phosphonate transport system permease protein